MVSLRHLGRALRARLTYANTISTLALFSVLGGGAYAATTLAPDSVGRRELKPHAVTPSRLADASVGTPKLAPRAVNFERLSSAVRAQVLRNGHDGAPGPRGPVGTAGPAGAQGPAGPAAVRIHYSAARRRGRRLHHAARHGRAADRGALRTQRVGRRLRDAFSLVGGRDDHRRRDRR